MNRVELPNKLEDETKTYTFDFVGLLAVGETISSQTVTATTYSGDDGSPSSIINGSATASGTIVSQSITGGTEGVIYELACEIVTSLSQHLILTGLVAVIPVAP